MILRDWFFPPRCIACGKLLEPGIQRATPAFCIDCQKSWTAAEVAECSDCFMAYCNCRCVPKVMEKEGITSFVKLVPYNEGTYPAVLGVIKGIKRHSSRRAFRFLAEALRDGVTKELLVAERKTDEETTLRGLKTVIAFLPRARSAKRREGFDQAEKLAAALSRATGIPLLLLLCREKDGVPQKSLTIGARRENLKGAFRVKGEAKGLRVLLVDDVVTTGTGMAEAAAALKAAGAAEILAVSVAYTVKKAKHK